jgi:4-hydroxy-tetrahydrodipicolinate synthase
MFQGSIPALVTPMRDDGTIDFDAWDALLDFHLREGTDGVVVGGTTGESPVLERAELEQLVRRAKARLGGRIPVIGGSGTNGTAKSIALSQAVEAAGADALLVVTPYYNKPTQDGLLRHFRAVAGATDIPIILYNVPGRTGVNMAAQTVARLAEVPNIVGVKEASGNLTQVCDIIRMTPRKFCVLSGDDALFFPMMALGAKGVISVTSNVAPRLMAELYDTYIIGEISRARDIHYQLWPLFHALFLETNPIPAKTALAMMGRIREEFRLPLSPMADANRKALARVLAEMKLA